MSTRAKEIRNVHAHGRRETGDARRETGLHEPVFEDPATQVIVDFAYDKLQQTLQRFQSARRIPVARIGLPEDIWLAVKFVIECEHFTGRTIDVDGGLAM